MVHSLEELEKHTRDSLLPKTRPTGRRGTKTNNNSDLSSKAIICLEHQDCLSPGQSTLSCFMFTHSGILKGLWESVPRLKTFWI